MAPLHPSFVGGGFRISDFADVSADLYEEEERILSKILEIIFEAKMKNDNQIIDLSEIIS